MEMKTGKRYPDFIIIGSARSGTTSLYHYLSQHPDVYMSPVKEPQYFAYEKNWENWQGPKDQDQVATFISHEESYFDLFKNAEDQQVVGEASTLYLYSKSAPQRIWQQCPDVRLIAILRDPAERALSHYKRLRKNNRDSLATFEQAMHAEKNRIENNYGWMWHYTQRGFYYKQLLPYFRRFGAHQICVVLFDDVKNNPSAVCKSLFQFLHVDDSFDPNTDTVYAESTGSPPDTAVPHRRTQATRSLLLDWYNEDILQLETLLQRDLSSWRKV